MELDETKSRKGLLPNSFFNNCSDSSLYVVIAELC